jgi:hypothetical protein
MAKGPTRLLAEQQAISTALLQQAHTAATRPVIQGPWPGHAGAERVAWFLRYRPWPDPGPAD